MAEIGIVAFAQCALQIAETILPQYRSKFSKHLYTQPQLLTLLCLMRYADWTLLHSQNCSGNECDSSQTRQAHLGQRRASGDAQEISETIVWSASVDRKCIFCGEA